MTYTICEPCIDVKDRACTDECPVDCIYEGGRMLYIHPDECVDCGACEPVCPVTAIFYEDDVPAGRGGSGRAEHGRSCHCGGLGRSRLILHKTGRPSRGRSDLTPGSRPG
jgi:NAD-dependent dihydropyrimidine dehydrogenase PreA subunit